MRGSGGGCRVAWWMVGEGWGFVMRFGWFTGLGVGLTYRRLAVNGSNMKFCMLECLLT